MGVSIGNNVGDDSGVCVDDSSVSPLLHDGQSEQGIDVAAHALFFV